MYMVMYVHILSMRTGRSFYVKIVKFGWYILWPCKIGEFEDGTCWTNRRSVSDFLKEH